MTGFPQHLAATLRLYGRNRMALLYSYLFPVIFLVAFAVLYRYDRTPLILHMGELLTVAALGGACFGLPTSLVSEREKGVWRRYRLAPIPGSLLIASTAVARYLTLLSAGFIQVVLSFVVAAVIVAQRPLREGTTLWDFLPYPEHPLQLLVAFSFVAFAFIGLGLVIAMLADNVPAVQALGQCIFLPMLIIGGVAVKLSAMPGWVQHASAYFPGRYAVEAIQKCMTDDGLMNRDGLFALVALFIIGSAGCIAASGLFRWDAQQRFLQREGKAWLVAALAAWAAVGLLAESQGRIAALVFIEKEAATEAQPPGTAEPRTPPGTTQPPPKTPPRLPGKDFDFKDSGATNETPDPGTASTAATRPMPASWHDVTAADINGLAWDAPPDNGVISPVARMNSNPGPDLSAWLIEVRSLLPGWKPGEVGDPVQRVRNLLYVAAVPDVVQVDMEAHVPMVVLAHLQENFSKEDLAKLLCWIALHPEAGEDSAAGELESVGLPYKAGSLPLVRQRTYYYAQKLLARVAGLIPADRGQGACVTVPAGCGPLPHPFREAGATA